MDDKKNIDKLFQSQLSDFEATPAPEVWDRIEAKLRKEKEDRKVIPLWWRVGGVAALLALLLTIGNGLFTADGPNNEVVIEDTTVHDTDDGSIKKSDAVVTEDSANPNRNSTTDPKETLQQKTGEDSNTSVTGVDHKNNKTQSVDPLVNTTRETTVAVEKNKKGTLKNLPEKKAPLIKDSPIVEGVDTKKEAVAKVSDPSQNDKNTSVPNTIKEDRVISKTEDAVAKEDPSQTKKDKDLPQEQKKSIFDAIEENKKEAIAQEKDKNPTPWEISPNAGPVYYNSLSGGSSIDPSFADNSQTGDVNFSYGVKVAYQINDRLSVRTGVQNVNVGYATGGIELASGPTELALKSIDYNHPGKTVLSAYDKGTVPAMPVDVGNPYGQLNLKSTTENAEIRQSITYYEVPIEAKYNLLNTRFGINMIGGFSTLFLGDSEVSVTDGTFRDVLGESNNLNNISFSTNIGLGFDYKISNRFVLNIEPMFKYQLNPYTDSSVDFKPYYFGVYSGLSFKF